MKIFPLFKERISASAHKKDTKEKQKKGQTFDKLTENKNDEGRDCVMSVGEVIDAKEVPADYYT